MTAPIGRHTLTPHAVVRNAVDAARWYTQTLGAEERGRVAVPDGRLMQLELWFGDSPVFFSDEFPEFGAASPLTVGGTSTVFHLYCDDVDEVWQRAIDADAEIRQPLADAFFGERYGQIADPFGHRWGLAQHLRDVPREEIARAVAAMWTGV